MPDVQSRTLMRAMIVDDHPLFCDALAMTLKVLAGLQTVETAGSLEEATRRLDAGVRPDLVVLDLNLPDVDGLDGLVRLRLAVPEVPVLVVSSMADPRIVRAALRAGAAGFVPKHAHRDTYRAALEAVREGRAYLPDGMQAEGEASASEEAIARLGLLTRQQARILQLICEGKLNKQIAFELAIAETTVKAHVTAIMRKLGVLSRTQAVLMAKEARFSAMVPEG
ncbi:response regulator transcription factor [Tabrizicola oligotrophica]|uniref:Response regulator transcription factor n=1 Tax=Tabrizicola oligotrophica TaxID=2710650 RepID=A0A6M0QP07_9RHOB|nr:response regulator transcription factor [Tabrizicola oligotrophica]NEY89159.1 response regulator transcription factor [Tabrizicola oligotrophica]